MSIAIRATELAKYIVTKCIEDKQPITNMQLQKILYCIQKDFLKRGKLAFGDNIESWQFGPVVPNAYYQFSEFGAMSITTRYKTDKEKLVDKRRTDYIIEQTRSMEPWDWIDRY